MSFLGVTSSGLLGPARKAVLSDRRSQKHALFSAFFQPVPSAVVKHDSLHYLVEKSLARRGAFYLFIYLFIYIYFFGSFILFYYYYFFFQVGEGTHKACAKRA